MGNAVAFNGQLKVFIDRNLSPQAQSAALARAAKSKLNELIGSGRASRDFRRYVDGREGVAEEAVGPAPSGQIVYRFNALAAVATFALSFLVSRSPRQSGRFRQGFYLGVDGKFVPMQQFNPKAVTADVREIVIGNREPYSRKVDVQLIGTQPIHFSVPAGLFDDGVAAIKRQFGPIVDVKRVYTMQFPGQYVLRRGRRAGKPVHSPALVITLRQ